MLCIEIADTGPGIPPAIREKIFEPFVTTKPKGTGLGLPTVARIVQAHNGSVCCREEPGGGTCFEIQLPFEAVS
jgi:signal transduction histidine kinase